MGKFGDRTLRRWENGESKPSALEYGALLSFASNTPYAPKSEAGKFKFIDLFAGIGGIRIPFQELGGKCVFSSEWDTFAQKTYRVNFGETPSGDITEIDAARIPDFDVLLAGFPCQPFSQAGLKRGFSDTRGTMFFEIERIVNAKRPKAFLLENVKQLKGHDKGRTLGVITEHLRRTGYTVDYAVLRAADFGVPQNRERIYIVGFDKRRFGLSDRFRFEYPVPPKTKRGWATFWNLQSIRNIRLATNCTKGTCGVRGNIWKRETASDFRFSTRIRPTQAQSAQDTTRTGAKFSSIRANRKIRES